MLSDGFNLLHMCFYTSVLPKSQSSSNQCKPHGRIPHVHVRMVHVDLGTQQEAAFRVLAILHPGQADILQGSPSGSWKSLRFSSTLRFRKGESTSISGFKHTP